MRPMTESHLHNAFAGESQARMRYTAYSEVAEEEDFPMVALLFESIAYAEEVHATNHLERMPQKEATAYGPTPYGLGNTSENLQKGIDGETFEVNEMYPVYLNTAQDEGEDRAEQSFEWALEAEKVHAGIYQEAKQAVDAGEDYQVDRIQICDVCGYTVEGDAPDRCPICGAPHDKFTEFA